MLDIIQSKLEFIVSRLYVLVIDSELGKEVCMQNTTKVVLQLAKYKICNSSNQFHQRALSPGPKMYVPIDADSLTNQMS